MQIVRVVLSTCLFLTVVANALAQSTDPCNNDELRRAWESDPIYTEAMELARTLENRGFVLECVRSSKQAAFFEGEKGAAWYKTKQGVFEVLFLPVSQNFEGLQIVAESKPGDATLTFFGERLIFQQRWIVPSPWSLSSTRICCLKCGEMMNSQNN
jgi:hypothetical protein